MEKFKQEAIKKIVEDFCQKLYNKKETEKEAQKKYIGKHNKMKLTEEQLQFLNKSSMYAEITEAINKQKIGKTPGPDGLPVQYYKELEDVLLKPFKKLFNCVEEEGKLPPTWTEVIISLIHKEHRRQRNPKLQTDFTAEC